MHHLLRDFSLNSLFDSRIHLESTFFHPITMNSLTASRFTVTTLSFHEFTNCFANFLLTYYLLRDFSFWETTLNSLWNHYETILKSLRNHYLLSDFFFEFTICFAISLWIDYLFPTSLGIHHSFREFTISFANIPWITICFAISLWIHYLFANSPWIHFSLWIYYLFRLFSMNSPSYNKFTILFAKSLCIHYHFENSLLIKYLFREISLNSLFVSVIHY